MYPAVRRLEHDWPGAGVVLRDMKLTPPSERRALDVSAEEREREYEDRWSHDAIAIGGCFTDLQVDEAANDTLRQFLEKKIREIVIDQDVATLLIPEHPPFTRRPPGQYGYYDTFNRDNVHLVDARSDPIASVSSTSVHLASGAEYPLDVLICATGFDAGSGCLTRIDIRGRDGQLLRENWQDGAVTHLGMMTTGFPNFFFINSVQSPSALFSPPLLGDYQIGYMLRLIAALKDVGGETVEPTSDAEMEWCTIISEAVEQTLLPRANSWWLGANIPGKARRPVTFIGGFVAYKRHAEEALEGLKDFVVDSTDPRRHGVPSAT
jgi:cation diffusion facilitator CzcD-associated flavoprotein CzcO